MPTNIVNYVEPARSRPNDRMSTMPNNATGSTGYRNHTINNNNYELMLHPCLGAHRVATID